MLIRFAAVLNLVAAPLAAQESSKEETCALQASVVGAIQQARLDRVKQDEVVPTLIAANPDWPDAMADAMPALVGWIYGQKRRDLRKVSLAEVSEQQCLDNWDQLQGLAGN